MKQTGFFVNCGHGFYVTLVISVSFQLMSHDVTTSIMTVSDSLDNVNCDF